jgi:DNA polymerase IV
MDAFFASVEQRDNPELKGKPIAVGGNKERGVVAAASYEARKFGVKSAMASKIAAQKCPELIFVKPRFEAYKEASNQMMQIFRQYTDLVEPLSLDEAYLDVTENKKNISIATDVAKLIRTQIKIETNLTASAGVSFNKFLAKVASGFQKPDGLTVITPRNYERFLQQLKIEDFYGIGKVTAQKMHAYKVFNGTDLLCWPEDDLTRIFGLKSGAYYYQIARGIDNRAVINNHIRKSIGGENTFENNILEFEAIKEEIINISKIVSNRAKRNNTKGKTITLKLKYFDFIVQTRSITINQFTNDEEVIFKTCIDLLNQQYPIKSLRLIGITLSNLDNDLPTENPNTIAQYLQLKLNLNDK